jgi:hypothetical protein
MKLHHLVAIATVTTFAGAVSAQTPPVGQPSQPSTSPSTSSPSSPSSDTSLSGSMSTDSGGFAKVDKDRDGNITKKEAASNKDLTKQWDTLDSNKDGKLDQGEFAQFEASGSAGGASASGSAGASSSGSTSSDTNSSTSTSSDKSSEKKPKF